MVKQKLKSRFLILCIVLAGLFSQVVLGAIPAKERAALIALYNATGGDGWDYSSNWKGNNNESDGFSKIGTEGTWYGVTVANDHVTEIKIISNYLNGFLPPELGDFNFLEILYLTYNTGLIGSIPVELGNLSNLKRLDLGYNDLSGFIPSQLGNLGNLESLDLSKNSLSGGIPSDLGNLLNLQYLYLNDNRPLGGSIPQELGNLGKLKALTLGNCYYISGSIPPVLGNLSNLEYLDMGYCSLTGSIPPELGNLSKLNVLELYYNGLSGSIPTTLTKLTDCHSISLSRNALYTNDETLRAFLDSRAYNWENSQTTPPANVSAAGVSNVAVRVSWTPINYNWENGGYLVYYSTTSGGPWTYAGRTSDKSHSYLDVYSLSLGTTYYFKVKTESKYYHNDLEVMSWDSSIVSGAPIAVTSQIGLDRTKINFAHVKGSNDLPDDQFFTVFPVLGAINWTASENAQWFFLLPDSGRNTGTVRVRATPYALAPGDYTATITISDSHASNSPQAVTVTMKVYEEGRTSAPFGNFSTPLNNSTVRSSIPVTGWALDDIGVESVKLYREDGGKLVHIGDAAFVEGARPDLEQAYPDYPYNYRAGWGYMMLTNFLPNNGNGIFKIHAIAEDKEGNQTTLGVRTITCDNANAVKPFGAIDTPAQGKSASGDSYINWGWVLTPQPNSIPTDGSTIGVYVDGVFAGRPNYNIYREDIATFFPGYVNSNGAVGYFYLDTTAYENGVHNIYWTATDSGGNTDGIGSRYFTINNSGSYRSADIASAAPTINFNGNVQGQRRTTELLGIQKGYRTDTRPREVNCRESGKFMIEIEELERLVITFPAGTTVLNGYLEVGGVLRALPIGSHLDRKNGKLYWQPGPVYLGDYNLVFIEQGRGGDVRTRNVLVRILPKTFE